MRNAEEIPGRRYLVRARNQDDRAMCIGCLLTRLKFSRKDEERSLRGKIRIRDESALQSKFRSHRPTEVLLSRR